ncbi:MAG: GPW/gp25 family protein [Candidatus Devosia phytovorans]|uniref:GPW/gp25 family protein n=1 Tax=Candidatus Devosia phytovorans TaxID=3121372 RepID=A0AAJ5VW95_9HYPH|nr:GPW/gp25 family protein [Devosia sp.]WEK04563.1 MAG: GPW/gp25 family protein [Devosia sp.]
MSGVDRRTGKLISNYEHALQSVEVIFTTRIGERVMRRHFGAGMVELLGRAMTPKLFAAWQLLLAVGIDLWEPRFRVRGVYVSATPTDLRLGRAGVRIEVDYRPRALSGDFSVEGVRSFTIRFGPRVQIQ